MTTFFLPEAVRIGIYDSLQEIEDTVSGWISHLGDTIDGGRIRFLFDRCDIVPFLAFYMMKDYKLIERTVLALVPQRSSKCRSASMNIDEALGNYIRGQILVCRLSVSPTGYWIMGLPIHSSWPVWWLCSISFLLLRPVSGSSACSVCGSTISLKMLIYVAVVEHSHPRYKGMSSGLKWSAVALHLHPLHGDCLALHCRRRAGGSVGADPGCPLCRCHESDLRSIFSTCIAAGLRDNFGVWLTSGR